MSASGSALRTSSILFRSATFNSAVWNTIVIVLVSDVLKLLIGLGLALLVHQNLPARGIFRSLLMLPWAMPAFVAFLAWRVLYQPIGGGINLILTETGLYPYVVDWLGQRSTAMGSVIAASVWRGFPFWFVSILAALQSVPNELYEAARVDGANAWQRFWTVTAPGIKQVVIVTTLLSSIWTANGFEHVWLLTRGGPVGRHDGPSRARLFRHADAAYRRGGGRVGRDAAGSGDSRHLRDQPHAAG